MGPARCTLVQIVSEGRTIALRLSHIAHMQIIESHSLRGRNPSLPEPSARQKLAVRFQQVVHSSRTGEA